MLCLIWPLLRIEADVSVQFCVRVVHSVLLFPLRNRAFSLLPKLGLMDGSLLPWAHLGSSPTVQTQLKVQVHHIQLGLAQLALSSSAVGLSTHKIGVWRMLAVVWMPLGLTSWRR